MLAYLVNQLAHRETGVENVWIANPDDRLKLLVHGVTMLGPLSQLLDSRTLTHAPLRLAVGGSSDAEVRAVQVRSTLSSSFTSP